MSGLGKAFAAFLALAVSGFMALLLLLGLAGGAGQVISEVTGACGAAATGGSVTADPASVPGGSVAGFSGEQLVNAAQILRAGADLGVSEYGQTVGVMTAMGESTLVNVDRGDAVGPDSRGLFQQRANGAWGTYEQRMDPYTAATNFFRALLRVPSWETLPPTIAANRVQRNADPYYYTRYWEPARQVVAALAGTRAAQQPKPAPPKPAPPQPAPAGAAPVTNTAGPLSPPTQALADEVWAADLGVLSIGGTRPVAADMAGHPAGNAVDLMVGNRNRAAGDRVVAYLEQQWDRLGVDYIIWWQQIKTSPGGPWRPMADRGSDTANHMDHPHVNVKPGGGVGGPRPAGGAVAPGAQPCPEPQPGDVSILADGWVRPTSGELTSGFGARGGAVHNGLDIAPPCGTPIYAAGPGRDGGGPATVIRAGRSSGFGNLIVLDHGGGVVTRYAHMFDPDVLVSVGQEVTAGQQIARVGNFGNSTGCHVHFEVLVDGVPVDPAAFLAERGASGGAVDGP